MNTRSNQSISLNLHTSFLTQNSSIFFIDEAYQDSIKKRFHFNRRPEKYELGYKLTNVMTDEYRLRMQLIKPDEFIYRENISNISSNYRQTLINNIYEIYNPHEMDGLFPLNLEYGIAKYNDNQVILNDKIKPGYHKVLLSSPDKISGTISTREILNSFSASINESANFQILPIDILIEIRMMLFSFKGIVEKRTTLLLTDITKINDEIHKLKCPNQIGYSFCLKHFHDLFREMQGNGLLSFCGNCQLVFPFHQKRKYCSDKCAKAARNKRSYQRNKPKRIIRARESTRDLREFYQSRNVKK